MPPRPEPRWQPEVAQALTELAKHLPAATVGKMFGHPALYVAGKLSACAYGDGIGIKLPADTVHELLDRPGFSAFTPYGKTPMREWVHIRVTTAEQTHSHHALFDQSAALLLDAQLARRRR